MGWASCSWKLNFYGDGKREGFDKTSFSSKILTSSTAALLVSVWSLGLGSVPRASHFQGWTSDQDLLLLCLICPSLIVACVDCETLPLTPRFSPSLELCVLGNS